MLHLRNCSRRTLVVNGYPLVRLLDARKRVMPVKVKHGSSYMAIDPGPRRQVLKPGRELLSVIAWSATVTDPDPAKKLTSTYLSIAPVRGNSYQRFVVDADLGTTRELDITAWAAKLAN